MKVLGIIPARAGSKRIPRKNVRLLGGKPLVAHVIEAARACRRINRLVVSSDDPEVLAIAASYDPSLPLERPAELAGDQSAAIDYVRHVLGHVEAAGEGPFNAIAIMQPTSPFTLAEDIDATIELLHASGADSAVSIMEVDHAVHPLKLKRLEGDRLLAFWEEERGRTAYHELPRLYVRNCSVYVARRELVDQGEIIGPDCRGYLMPRLRSLDINDELDLRFAEFLMQQSQAAAPSS